MKSMKNIEYTKMAYLYDKFYVNKNYSKEVDFIKNFIKNDDAKILDAGCGTGNHAKILYDLGYKVAGFDQSQQMVDIANTKIKDCFWVGNLLNYNHKEKYDLIISFFAVFNHLKNYKEFKMALLKLKSNLKDKGTIIIDLHNPQTSGTKQEIVENATRLMKWKKCNLLKKEFSTITYKVGQYIYKTKHIFKIFNINKLYRIAKEIGFNLVEFYENYNKNSVATKSSKNIQMVLSH